MKNNIILTIVCCMLMSSTPHKYTMLCLGDSYTIGEAVAEEARFPNQAAALLESKGFAFDKPKIIAKTGWTTDELAAAIVEEKPAGKFDVVTLLIGVNNQYRSRDKENYRQEFTALLHTAIAFSESGKKGVFVVSIPDWGVTPFAKKDSRPAKEIGAQIDAFNAIGKEVALANGVHFIEITKESRKAGTDASLIAEDGLHPSASMYRHWAELLAKGVEGILH
jgi:lysophospholipase L1-like esterase